MKEEIKFIYSYCLNTCTLLLKLHIKVDYNYLTHANLTVIKSLHIAAFD